MRLIVFSTFVFVMMTSGISLRTAVAKEPTDIELFDGKTLKGWNGDEKWFRVEDGVIIAGSATERIPHNQFLCTNDVFSDFELSVEAKLVGKGNNAGVQFRTKRIPNDTEVIGYQADIGFVGNGTCWGALYDESRRRKFLAESPEKAMKAVKRGDWNTLKVIARGDHIQIYLNGVKTVDYTETEKGIEREGVIALQVHSGPPLEVHYRNLRFRKL
ncbi:MAG: DUF1080 domain-containing protein [Planctomycetota bacterium]